MVDPLCFFGDGLLTNLKKQHAKAGQSGLNRTTYPSHLLIEHIREWRRIWWFNLVLKLGTFEEKNIFLLAVKPKAVLTISPYPKQF